MEGIKKMKHRPHGPYEKYIKRPMDFVLALFALICLSPVIAATALLVKIKLGSPVLFIQERPGRYGKIFRLYKFRTMTNEKDPEGNLLPDNVRLTRFGRLLRSTSLDELPELINMVKGDMSLIGPRPLLVRYLDYYNEYENRRHEVRPGLTGLAQISGRNTITWRDKFARDVEYVDSVSFCLDCHIFIQTIKKVFTREGIEFRSGETVMDYFQGTNRLE